MSGGMNCPDCGGEMLPGAVRVRGTIGGFALVGLSWQHLWWTDTEEWSSARQRLLTSGDSCAAHRCVSCGMIAFRPFTSHVRADPAGGA